MQEILREAQLIYDTEISRCLNESGYFWRSKATKLKLDYLILNKFDPDKALHEAVLENILKTGVNRQEAEIQASKISKPLIIELFKQRTLSNMKERGYIDRIEPYETGFDIETERAKTAVIRSEVMRNKITEMTEILNDINKINELDHVKEQEYSYELHLIEEKKLQDRYELYKKLNI
jgi:hypothetical protein